MSEKDNGSKASGGSRALARSSRRGFLKKAVVAGVAVASTATLAKKTGEILLKEDYQKVYLNDVLPGDSVLASRRYVVMTKEEKKALLARLFDFHGNPEA